MTVLQQDHALACAIFAYFENEFGLAQRMRTKRDEIELTKLIRKTHVPRKPKRAP